MWESKDNCIDVNYNTDHVWFDGINGHYIQKPADIRKWEESKCYKLIEKHFPRVKADKMLADLSSIALEWAKNYVRQRQTFKLNTKGENMAPLAFQHDPDGTYHSLAVQLRNYETLSSDPEDERSSFEPVGEDEVESKSAEDTKTPEAPPREKKLSAASIRASSRSAARAHFSSPEREKDGEFKTQREVISAWIDDPDHPATETCRYPLELYAQLNDSEFAYVTELQVIYDETRCFFLQWILGKEIKELVNSARISNVQSGKPFTWIHARAETLKSMTDVTLTARFLALTRLKRAQGTTAKLWISQVLTRKALLEDPKLPSPVQLPECLHLEILVRQMSAQETTVFDNCPAIGDDLLQKTVLGQKKFTLDKLKRSIDACSNPPYFRGVSTPITDLLDSAESRPPKQKRDQSKPKDSKAKDSKAQSKAQDKDKGANNPQLARRPEHEQPAKFPGGLKRPDLEATIDGNKITSEAQRQLYDGIKRGNCTRCHKGGHIRKDCRDPKAKWEDKFDKEKAQYSTSVLKWQQRASEQKDNPTATPKTVTLAPTLHVKPEKRFHLLDPDYGSDDEPAPLRSYRLTMQDPDDTDDDDDVPFSRLDDADTVPAVVAPTPAPPLSRRSWPMSTVVSHIIHAMMTTLL
jgi:hypothetical protein